MCALSMNAFVEYSPTSVPEVHYLIPNSVRMMSFAVLIRSGFHSCCIVFIFLTMNRIIIYIESTDRPHMVLSLD